MSNRKKLCESEVKKNLVLAELGEPLTIPLATLNQSCDFRREWERIQTKWHGVTEERKAATRKWQKKNPEKVKAATRKWQKENPEKVKAATRKWQKENREKANAAARRWQKKNPEKASAAARRWQKKNPEKVKAASAKWRKENPAKVLQYALNRKMKRLKNAKRNTRN